MKKKKVILASLILFLAASAFLFSATSKGPEKPNIIFLLTDDQRWDALGAMGNDIIQTPHLNKLAGNGILFKNAYVTTSICAVSRASILSGQYQSRHKIDNFTKNFTPEALEQTYPLLMRNAGYTTGFIGKYGVGKPEDQPKEQYDFWACSEKGQPDYELRDEKGDYLHHTDKAGNDIKNFLDQYGRQGPFCLSVSFKAPHVQDRDPRQFIPHPRYNAYYADVKIPLPETADPQYWKQFPNFFRTEKNIARERWHLRFKTPEMYQESVKNYYRLITGVDDVVGSMVNQLEEMGLADNTIIIFMGDNGFYLGEHGLAGKWYGHEESIRVPLIVYDPRQAERLKGAKPEQIALNIDIAPTILSLAGIQVPQVMQGEDLMRIAGNTIPEREDFFYEHSFMGSPGIPKTEGVVRKDLKYMRFIEHDYEELYDLKQDPGEKQNLTNVPAYRDKLNKMRGRYLELKERVK